jgi:hypothetical protein
LDGHAHGLIAAHARHDDGQPDKLLHVMQLAQVLYPRRWSRACTPTAALALWRDMSADMYPAEHRADTSPATCLALICWWRKFHFCLEISGNLNTSTNVEFFPLIAASHHFYATRFLNLAAKM